MPSPKPGSGRFLGQQLPKDPGYTRTDSLTLKYEVTIDDPGAYSKPWTTSNTVRWRPGFELMEYVCQENEKSSQHMIGRTAQPN